MKTADLKVKLKAAEATLPKSAQVRLHRALSWLGRAEDAAVRKDADAEFLFLWISFNAAYARELGLEQKERDLLADYFARLLRVDRDRRIHKILFENYSGPIRMLVENRFVFEPFWRALRGHDPSERWALHFNASKKAALAAIVGGDTPGVLRVVFDRLYVLRNQIVHGGATWGSGVNRDQVRDGRTILLAIVPVLIELMLDNPDVDLGEINYPVV